MSISAASEKDIKKREFIISGNMLNVVLYISLPLIALNAFTYLYGIIDTIVLAGKESSVLSSVVMIDQLKNMFTAIGGGLATGGSIIVSRLIGKNDFDRAKKVSSTILVVAVIVSMVLMAAVLPFSKPILRLAGFTDELIDLGLGYFIVQICTVGVMIFNSVFLGLEKSRGATLNVLFINLAVMGAKIGLTLMFVFVFEMDTVMVAVATLLANLIVTAYAFVMLGRKRYLFRFSRRNVSLKKEILAPLGKLGFPVFLGKFVFSLGKVIVNAMAVNYGDDAPGALGISNHISGSVTNVTGSVEESTSAIISQNIGAGKKNRAYSAFFCSLGTTITIAVIGVILLVVFEKDIVSFFAKEESYAALISKIFGYERVGIIALAINSAVMGLIYGLGYTKLSMIVNLSRLFVFRVPSMIIMMNCFPSLGAESLGIAMLVSNCGIGLMSVVIAVVCLIKLRNKVFEDKIKI